MSLELSNIRFDERKHTYTNNEGKLLSGVTSLIKRHLFADKYANIPEYILQRASKRGTEIHALCTAYNLLGITEEKYQEVVNYAQLLKENDIEIIANEYLVSDNENYATMIDQVGSDYSLYDIKTTSVLDKEYLSWQLSIGAYLFELQNADKKVNNLYGVWLRNEKAELVEVTRIEDYHIKALFDADVKGKKFENPFKKEGSNIDKLAELERSIVMLKAEIQQIEDNKAKVLSEIKEQMQKSSMRKWETAQVTISIVEGSIRKSFDSKKFQTEHEDLYNKYIKETQSKGHIKVKLNN